MRNKAVRIHGKRGIVRPGQFGNGPLQNWLSDARSPFERSQAGAIKRELQSNETVGGEDL
jgi:hypothetical protein